MANNLPLDDSDLEAKDKFQVFINDISWNDEQIHGHQGKERQKIYADTLPKQITFDIPENVLTQAKKNPKNFNDVIETFIYSALTRKFMHEVYSCQIWILD